MNRTIGVILIIAGLALGIWGVSMLGDSEAAVSIGNLSIEAEDQGQQTQSYILIALGVIALIAGVFTLRR